MSNKKQMVEILAPAGSYESFLAAVHAGADAVYTGGTRFGARAHANNMDEAQLLEAISYAHLHGCNVYMTVNTLLKEDELRKELYEYLLPYYEHGLDAVIVQDVGVLRFVRHYFPDLPVHVSTQMTITNALGAEFLKQYGVERIVPARELNLEEVRKMKEATGLEIECFVHGALCYCYSGQCLYSSMIGGRSGNRGQCAQPCRLQYRMKDTKKPLYLMSLKDICTLELIPELIEAGIDSFKIEGRMKKPEYVAAVTAMYRKYADLYEKVGKKDYQVAEEDRQMLMDLYNRGGSCSGYYHQHNGKDMVTLEKPNHTGTKACVIERQKGRSVYAKALTKLHKGDVLQLNERENMTLGQDVEKGGQFSLLLPKQVKCEPKTSLYRIRNEKLIRQWNQKSFLEEPKQKIHGNLILSPGKSVILRLDCGQISVQVEGAEVQKALNQPMDKARIEKQIRKTGGTGFEFEGLQIQMEGEIFLSMQALNEVRRIGLERLKEALLKACMKERRIVPYDVSSTEEDCGRAKKTSDLPIHALASTKEQFLTLLGCAGLTRLYVDANALEQIWTEQSGKWLRRMIAQRPYQQMEIYLAMPHIFRENTIQKYTQAYEMLFVQSGIQGVLIRNMESYRFLRIHGYTGTIVTDHHLYVFNREAKAFWMDEGVTELTAPLELNERELKEAGVRGEELVVYGHAPMMISAGCIRKTTTGCTKKSGFLTMTDRYQKPFLVRNCCDVCCNVIYNTDPLVLANEQDAVDSLEPAAVRLEFTIEDEKRTKEIAVSYADLIQNHNRLNMEERFPDGYTKGHFRRGIK